MTFEKIQEEIERVGNYVHILIRTLKPSRQIQSVSDQQVIADLISSNYHHWRGEEEPEGIKVSMGSTNEFGEAKSWTLMNHKIYGFFDNSKIKVSHYKQITFDDFYAQLTNAIALETENDNTFLRTSKELIKNSLKQTSTFYMLDLDKVKNKNLVAELQVYTFFYAFISIDGEHNRISLIQFSED